jgi:glycosyltransferase involved in cell wall biosynthesis
MHGTIAAAREGLYANWRQAGVSVNFLVHDLLPITLPQCFPQVEVERFERWLAIVAEEAHGLICTTQATADELKAWIAAQQARVAARAEVFVCPPGADFKSTIVSRGLPWDAATVLDAIASHQSFLSVGTVEPRKGYDQTLRAFERLWSEGAEICLVIVGKKGWMVEELAERLRRHPQLGKRLFWLEAISDEYLENLYGACRCLIAASEGEGFGLPLIEAARHSIPIIARDIPVFREVAGAHAVYFSGSDCDDLARAIRTWRKLYAENRHPKTDNMRWLTWAESVERLKTILLRSVGSNATNVQLAGPQGQRGFGAT